MHFITAQVQRTQYNRPDSYLRTFTTSKAHHFLQNKLYTLVHKQLHNELGTNVQSPVSATSTTRGDRVKLKHDSRSQAFCLYVGKVKRSRPSLQSM